MAELRRILGTVGVSEFLSGLRWFGHVVRKTNNNLVSAYRYTEIAWGNVRHDNRPKKNWGKKKENTSEIKRLSAKH